MAYRIQWGVAALAALVLGVAAVRATLRDQGGRDGRRAVQAAPLSCREAQPSVSPRVTPSPEFRDANEGTAVEAARRLSLRAAALQTRVEERQSSPEAFGPEDLRRMRDLQEETAFLGARLASRLRDDPSAWPSVVDFLTGLDDLKSASRILDAISPAVGEAAEARWIAVLQSGTAPKARELAASAFSMRDTPESLSALARAFESDPELAVRRAALRALADRKRRTQSPEEARLIEELVRHRIPTEQDAAMREIVFSVIARDESVPPMLSPPAGHRLFR